MYVKKICYARLEYMRRKGPRKPATISGAFVGKIWKTFNLLSASQLFNLQQIYTSVKWKECLFSFPQVYLLICWVNFPHSLRTYFNEEHRVSNCVTRFLKQFEAESIEAMEIGNLLTNIEESSSSLLAVLATIWNSVDQ